MWDLCRRRWCWFNCIIYWRSNGLENKINLMVKIQQFSARTSSDNWHNRNESFRNNIIQLRPCAQCLRGYRVQNRRNTYILTENLWGSSLLMAITLKFFWRFGHSHRCENGRLTFWETLRISSSEGKQDFSVPLLPWCDTEEAQFHFPPFNEVTMKKCWGVSIFNGTGHSN